MSKLQNNFQVPFSLTNVTETSKKLYKVMHYIMQELNTGLLNDPINIYR